MRPWLTPWQLPRRACPPTTFALPAEVDDAVSDFLQQDSESAERFLDWIDREAAKLDAADGGHAIRSAREAASEQTIWAVLGRAFPDEA